MLLVRVFHTLVEQSTTIISSQTFVKTSSPLELQLLHVSTIEQRLFYLSIYLHRPRGLHLILILQIKALYQIGANSGYRLLKRKTC